MDIVALDDVGVAAPGVGSCPGPDGLAGDSLDKEVHCFAIQVLGIAFTLAVGIVPGTPQAAGTNCRSAKVVSDVIQQLHKGLVRFFGESVTVRCVMLSAPAFEFIPAPVPDAIPERAGFRGILVSC